MIKKQVGKGWSICSGFGWSIWSGEGWSVCSGQGVVFLFRSQVVILTVFSNNIREYQSIKFFRGSKRKHDEMQKLADAGLDFEYRRLLISENETDLHVAFSKMVVWHWLAWSSLALALYFLQHPILSFIFIGLAVLSLFFSYLNKRFFQFVMRGHNIALGFVDGVIFDKYGIEFR